MEKFVCYGFFVHCLVVRMVEDVEGFIESAAALSSAHDGARRLTR